MADGAGIKSSLSNREGEKTPLRPWSLVGLGLLTWVVLLAIAPRGQGSDEAAAILLFSWLFVAVPGAVLGLVAIVAGAAMGTGRGWGAPVGGVAAGITLIGSGWLLATSATSVPGPFESGDRNVPILLEIGALMTAAAVALTAQQTRRPLAVLAAGIAAAFATIAVIVVPAATAPASCARLAPYAGVSGQLVYFGRRDLCLADMTTGQTRSIYPNLHLGDPSLSPDGNTVAFATATTMALLSVNSGVVSDLGIEGGNPAWSPNGRYIAFDGGPEGPLSVLTVATGESLLIASQTGDLNFGAHPAWSPDGRRLAFMRDDRLWLVGIDGTGLKTLTSDSVDAQAPDWSPDGSTIAFEGHAGEDSIFLVDADGSHMRRLASGAQDPVFPRWAPDSRHVAFVSRGPEIDPPGDLVIVMEDGSAPETLARGVWEPDWSGEPTD